MRPRLGENGVTNGDINERGDAVLIKHKVHEGVFNLVVHHTGVAGMVCSMETVVLRV